MLHSTSSTPDSACDPSPWLQDHALERHLVLKSTAVRQVRDLVKRGNFDVFINLCDGAWDEDRAGIEVVQTLERLGAAFTGANSAFFEPTREAMKLVCHQFGIATPNFMFAPDPATAALQPQLRDLLPLQGPRQRRHHPRPRPRRPPRLPRYRQRRRPRPALRATRRLRPPRHPGHRPRRAHRGPRGAPRPPRQPRPRRTQLGRRTPALVATIRLPDQRRPSSTNTTANTSRITSAARVPASRAAS